MGFSLLLLILLVFTGLLVLRGRQAGIDESNRQGSLSSVEEIHKDLAIEESGSEQQSVVNQIQPETESTKVGNDFDAWAKSYIDAPKAKQAELEAEGVKLALARKTEMVRLIEADPEQAIKRTISVVQRRNLPPSVRKHVEEHISNEGQLVTMIATKFDPQPKATMMRQATISGTTYQAFTYGQRNDRRFDNKTIPLNGIMIDGKFAINESPLRVVEVGEFEPAVMKAARKKSSCPVSTEPTEEKEGAVAVLEGSKMVYLCQGGHIAAYGNELLAAAMARDPDIEYSAWSEGAKTLLYISIIYKDQSGSPIKTDMNAVNAFFQANSYNKTSITTTFTPTYTMSKNAMEYGSLDEIINEARALAAAGGYNYLNYTLETIRYDGGIGDFGGVAGVGGRNNMLKTQDAGTAAHEIGHNLGLWHANFWGTTDGTTIGPGSNQEYLDFFSQMGSGAFPYGHFNACEKNILDWIPTANTTAVTASGTFRIYAHDMNTFSAGNKYGITFVKDVERTYWLEYRQNSVRPSSEPWVMNGVTLLWDPWSNSNGGTQLLDTTPGSPNGIDDSSIAVGRTFSDTAAGVHFTLKERGGTSPNLWADVIVNVGTFSGNAVPTLSLAASSTTVQANTAVNFTATASDTNGDTLAYHWDFGDNTFGTNASTVTKSWATNGSKRVTCIVSDMKGGTVTKYIYVNVVNAGTYAISGNITNSGVPQAGVTVSDGARSAVSDSLGNYAILNVPNGTYTLTPLLLGTSFSPSTITSVSVASASVTGKFFTATTIPLPANGPGSGITRDWWTGISGSTVASLTTNAAYPNSPTGTETIATLFEAPLDWAENYGQRMHGYFIAPTTGNYRFYIASDDNSELWLSTDSTTASAVKIASVTDWTNSREWSKYLSQKSAAIALTAGQRYYIRALHKEGAGGDNLAVGVEFPNGSYERPVPFHRLDPWPSITWATATQASANESGTLTLTAQLSSVTPQNVTVPFTVTGGTATGADYTIGNSQITITAGSTTGTTTITITPDSIHELNGETVILTIGTPTNAAKGASLIHTATIRDDDNIAPVVYAGVDQAVSLSGSIPWTPAHISTTGWYDAADATTLTASSGEVSQWQDKSGNSLHLIQGNAAYRPTTGSLINGRNALDFTYDEMTTTSNPFGATVSNALVIAVHKVDSIQQGALFSLTGTLDVANRWSSHFPWADGNVYFDCGDVAVPNRISASSGVSEGNVLLSSFYCSTGANVQQVHKNGSLLIGDSSGHSVATTGNIHVGGIDGLSQDTTIGEFIIINGTVDATNREKLEGYLAHKWGTTANLPAAHPFKSVAPTTPSVTVNLDATVNDPNADPLTTAWTLVSGPATVPIASPSSVDTTVSLTVSGTYVFRLTANDTYGPITDDVVIKVNPSGQYSVVYNGNGSTGGNEPVDTNFYSNAATVTVLGNTGNLTKTGRNFTGWNTLANGTGIARAAGNTFAIGSANVTLYAQWAFNSPYDEWFATANLGQWIDASFNGDSNSDGMANGLSWLLGATSPQQNGNPFLPQATSSSGNLSLSFKMLKNTKRGTAVLSLQYSRDMGVTDPWTSHTIVVPDATGSVAGVNFVVAPINGTDHNQIQATIPSSAAGGTGKIFARMVGVQP